MTIVLNVLLILLGGIVAIVAALGETHNPSAERRLQRLTGRGWIIVISVFFALLFGVAKEFSTNRDQAEQRELLKDILASRRDDHHFFAALLQSQSSHRSTFAPSADNGGYQKLLKQREQLLQATEKELIGATASGRPGAGPAYRNLQSQIRDLDAKLEAYNKKMVNESGRSDQ